MLRTLIYRAHALALGIGIRLVRTMDPVRASNLGGLVMRLLGPLLGPSRIADANLRAALPHLDAAERSRVIRGVWDNLGRTAAEMPHLSRFHRTVDGPGFEFVGDEHLIALRDAGGPALFFSAHLANWELVGPAFATLGVTMAGFYRAMSNPLTDELIRQLRRDASGGEIPLFAKGSQGAREALAHLGRGGFLGMMMDQKMNDGIPVAFFGRDAMTAPALAHFAARFRCPVMPIHVVRLGPARFRVVCEAPLVVSETGDRTADAAELTRMINATLEGWIRNRPEDWLWLHRRWPKDQSARNAA